MIKKTSSNQSCGRDRECKMVRFFKVPQYSNTSKMAILHIVILLLKITFWAGKVALGLNLFNILTHDVASGSDITPCFKIDKPLVIYVFSINDGLNNFSYIS